MIAVPPATGTDFTLATRVVSSTPSRLARTSGSTSGSPAAARLVGTPGRIRPRPATPTAATPAPAVSLMRSRRPITARGWELRPVRPRVFAMSGCGVWSIGLSLLASPEPERARRRFCLGTPVSAASVAGAPSPAPSSRKRWREDDHGPFHAGVDRAVIGVGPGVGEGDAVAARKRQTLADRRVQVLLGEQDARCSLAIGVRITGRRRRLAGLGEVVHLCAGARIPDVGGEAPGRRQLEIAAARHAARL